ncbi:choice-of-anchor L domain-containing protein [Flavisericum labens]|uniref:choice-of-anchor L domain-containing protein n=1 Tax=Flavisericum labens TaxID=3377112 RepID=UPI00387A856C
MKKSLHYICVFILLIFSFNTLFSQQVTIDNSVPLQDLIENNLANSCVEISNVSSSINGSLDGIGSFGSFEGSGTNFPLSNGIVISTGNAASGGNVSNGTDLSDGTLAWGTDPDIETFLGVSNTVNATSIEFDFVALSDSVIFNYLIASEEYFANYPCNSSDGFVFLIRESSSTGPYQNIALVPGTSTPVTISNIHDEIITQCPAANEQYFDGYSFPETNYNGRTTVLSAGASVTPNTQYHVKIIVADQGASRDPSIDTAVFIEANTFTELELGEDINTCSGSVILNGEIQNPLASYSWYRNGSLLSSETNPILTATQSGLYRVEISINGCIIQDDVTVTIDTELTTAPITPYQLCDSNGDMQETFDLSTKNTDVINAIQNLPPNYSISYHLTDADAQSNSSNITSPISSGPRTVYVRVEDMDSGCLIYGEFELIVNQLPTITQPSDLNVCDNDNNPDGSTLIDLSQKNNEITSGQTNLLVTYHSTPLEANNGSNAVQNPYSNTNSSETLYIRVTNLVTGCSNSGATLTINVTNGNTGIIRNTQFIDACDQEHDGFANFDITQRINTILNGETGFLLPTYHTSTADAESGANPIPDPTNFQNTVQDEQVVYARLVDSSTGCHAIVPLELHTNLLLTATNIPQLGFAFCDDDNDGSVDIYFNQIASVIANNLPNINVTFYETQSNRDNSVMPIDTSNPYPLTGPQTIYLNLDNGFCSEVSEVILRINPVVTFTPVAPIDYCDTDSDGFTTVDFDSFDATITGGNTDFNVRYYLDPNDADAGPNQLPRFYDTGSGTFYARIENNTTNCYTVNEFQINVLPAPAVMQPSDITICDDDQDGFFEINLNDKISEAVSNTNGLIIDFFNDFNNANNNTSPITNTTNYNSNTQTIFIRVQTTEASACFNIVSFNVMVNTLPVIPNIAPFQMCVDSGVSSANFIFSDKDAEILNGQTGKEVFYFQDEGFTMPIDKNNPYSSSGAETIYVRVENITDPNCNSTSSFTLEVGSNPTYNTNFSDFPPVCQNGAGSHTFDLDAKRQEIAQGSTDALSIKFYATLSEAQNNTSNDLPDLYTSQTLQGQFYVRIENTSNSCTVIEEVRFITFPTPVITSANIAPVCDTDYDGNTTIDLNTTVYQVTNVRFSDVTVSYFEDQNLTIEIPSSEYNNYAASNKIIYIKIANSSTQCYDSAPLPIEVNLPPSINTIASVSDCDSNTDTYDLSQVDTFLVDNVNNVSISYYSSSVEAASETNAFQNKVYNYSSPGSYTIFSRIENLIDGCPAFTSFNLIISPNPIANTPPDLIDCDDDYDGFRPFDLSNTSSTSNAIRGAQNASDFTVTFYTNLTNAENATNPVEMSYPAQDGETIYARIENNMSGCFSTTQFNIRINPLPIVPIEDIVPLCNDSAIVVSAETGIAGDTYLWSTGSTSPEILLGPDEIGDYSVTVTRPNILSNDCSYTHNFSVVESDSAIINFTQTVDFSDPNSITIDVSGIGDYIYILDNGEPQTSNVFDNVSFGPHLVTVRDLNGCLDITKNVFVFDIPKFFTPNNDSVYDTWHIVGANQLPGTIVHIYNRYGKLLKSLPYTSTGWDGTFNGQNMPSDDYWFIAKIIQNGESFDIKGHFTLKR